MKTSNTPHTCITPNGHFHYGIHKPSYSVKNLRQESTIEPLGQLPSGEHFYNTRNFPEGDLQVEGADWIYEIPNPFPFRGSTYIDKEWADASCQNLDRIRLPEPEPLSLSILLKESGCADNLLQQLPRPLLLTLATCSTDQTDLIKIAETCCTFSRNETGEVTGLAFQETTSSGPKPVIHDHDLFEAVANNPYLPDNYKIAMVIRPGAQGGSEIVGDWTSQDESHIFEYLRRNSYIAGGHYAANMADNAIRYSIAELSNRDIKGLRHLYYQRLYIRLAEILKIEMSLEQRTLSETELETLRNEIITQLHSTSSQGMSTLWGWNFGFDFAPSGYRLHASHQQIHQQYAMVPETVSTFNGDPHHQIGNMRSYSCGDLVSDFVGMYGDHHHRDFFKDYFLALDNNKRMDGREDLESSLIVWQDDNVLLFVPKAQTSQWELQLMTKQDDSGHMPGNILETNMAYRDSLDQGILKAQKALAGLGARMVTSIEFSKRIGHSSEYQQPLLYSFLPRLPQSPGAFSEAQLRFINGHYPEDFAFVCRRELLN